MSNSIKSPSTRSRPKATRQISELSLNDPEAERSYAEKSGVDIISNGEAIPKDEDTATLPGEQPKRRKPRKLVRRSKVPVNLPDSPSTQMEGTWMAQVNLDSRINRLEEQYHQLHKRLDTNAVEIGRLQATTKSQKSTTSPLDTITRTSSGTATPKTTALSTQQDVLHNTTKALVSLEGASRKQHRGASDEEIEEIPRSEGPKCENTSEKRTVSLTGNYKIPLPAALTTEDVRAIQSGITAAGSVAREITAAIRGSGQQGEGQEIHSRAQTQFQSGNRGTPQSPRSWSALLSDCGKLVANAANAIEMDAAVEARNGSTTRKDQSKPAGPTMPMSRKSNGNVGGTQPPDQTSTKKPPASRSKRNISNVGLGGSASSKVSTVPKVAKDADSKVTSSSQPSGPSQSTQKSI